MDKGRFYFISDDFFHKHDTERVLMQNKENVNGALVGRPCFMAFPDKEEHRIFWCIPISSKVAKYKEIVKRKNENRTDRSSKPRECDTIRFGEVLGRERAFLVQNMFPVTDTYILEKYIDKNSGAEVRVERITEADIISRAEKVLRLHRNGVKLLFGDVDRIYRELQAELMVTVS